MKDVPCGWKESTLGELGRYFNGRAFKKNEWKTDGRPIVRIQNLTGSSAAYNHFQGEVEARYVVRPGDLLVSWAATLGAYIWTGPQAILNQHIFKVESRINVRFHKYLLDHKLSELMQHTHGSGMVHITRGRFDALRVVVPGLDEQRRIVEVLEDHLSRLDTAEREVRNVATRADRLWQAVADDAIWRPGWYRSSVGSLLREPMRNGRSHRAVGDGESGIRTLTLTAVTRNEFTDERTKVTSTDPAHAEPLWLAPGDIFVQRANTAELVGTSARYEGSERWAIYPDLLIRLRPDEGQVDGRYLAAVLRTERSHRDLRAAAKGLAGSMPKIDQSAIARLGVPLPSLDQQRSVVRELGHVDDGISALARDLELQRSRSKALRRAVLTAAVEGRLTGRHTDEIIEELAQ